MTPSADAESSPRGTGQVSRALGISTAAVMFALLAVVAAGTAAKPGKSSALGGTLNMDRDTDVK